MERNPLVHLFGWTPLVLLKLVAVLCLAALPFVVAMMPLPKQGPFLKRSMPPLGVLCAFYVVVVALNIGVAA